MHFSANKKGAYLLLLYSLGSFTYSIPLIKLLHESKWDVVWQGIYCIFVYSVIWWLYPKTMQRLTVWCAQSCAKHTSRRPDRICFSWSILKPPVLHNFTKGHEKKGLLMRKKEITQSQLCLLSIELDNLDSFCSIHCWTLDWNQFRHLISLFFLLPKSQIENVMNTNINQCQIEETWRTCCALHCQRVLKLVTWLRPWLQGAFMLGAEHAIALTAY